MVDHAAALLEQNRLFGAAVAGADPTTPVPTCPGWTLQQLFRHLGRGHRWSAQIIREQRSTGLDPREVVHGKPPEDAAGALEWFHEGGQLVLDAVASTGPETPVWTFLGPRPAAWWIRRRLHEATVHRADAEIALGIDYAIEPELAADGISEWIDLVVLREPQQGVFPLDPGTSLHLHATDTDAEWTLRGDPSGVTWAPVHEKSTAAVQGRAVDLFLTLLRRRFAEDVGLETFGDAKVWTTWLERTPF